MSFSKGTAWDPPTRSRSSRLTESPSNQSFTSERSSSQPLPSDLQSQGSVSGKKKGGALSSLRKFGRTIRKGRSTNENAAATPAAETARPKRAPLRDWQSDAQSASTSIFGGDGAPRSGMLAQIERGTFNLEAEMARLPEKGIASLRSDLAALEAECGEELRRSVYDNYKPFIEASQGISKLEGEMQQLRGLITAFASMVQSLKGVASTNPSKMAEEAQNEATAREVVTDWRDTADGAAWAAALADIDVAIAEKRCLDALNAIKAVPDKLQLPDAGLVDFEPAEELEKRRQSLVPILEAGVAEASASRAEARLAAGVLAAVTGRPRALKVLLAAHSLRLKRAQQQLLKPQNTGGGEADGTDFAGVMAQRVFSTIGSAADDVTAVFGEEASDLSAAFLVWALQETERAATLLKRHALTPFAVPAGLGATVRCVLLMRTQALALQATHGISLAPRLTRELWPVIDTVLQRRLRRIGDNARKSLAAEVDRIAAQGLPKALGASGWGKLMASFQSADDMLDEVNFCVTCLKPLGGPRVAAALRKGVLELFTVYTGGMAEAFTKYKGKDGRFPERLDPAVDEAMETASLLHEQFLPEAVSAIAEEQGEVFDFDGTLPAIETLAEALGCALE